MLRSEGLHVRHALQTVSALEAVVARSFGPDGGQVLFTRDTGQVLLTRHGTRILTALRLENPLARMVVECVWKHSSATGEGSKTFILLLASLLRGIQSHAPRGTAGTGAAARRLAEQLLAFGLDELADVIAVGVVPYCSSLSPRKDSTGGNAPVLQSLVGAFLHTRLGHAPSDVIGPLTCELLSRWVAGGDDGALSPALRFIDGNFPALHTAVSGFPIGCSRLLEGQVIHRDFATPPPSPADRQPIKALAVTEPLQPDILGAGAILELDWTGAGRRGAGGAATWAQGRLERAFGALRTLGVTLLLSSVKQSEATLALARRGGVCVLECVPEDELSLACRLGGAEPVSDWSLIERRNIAEVTFCRPISLGGHRYAHIGFPGSSDGERFRPHSLVVCGPGEGQTGQSACAVRDALRMLLATLEPADRTGGGGGAGPRASHTPRAAGTADRRRESGVLEPGCVIAVGGAFEWLLHRALVRHADTPLRSDASSPSLLAEALLSVPRQIYAHRPRRYPEAQTRLLSCLRDGGSFLTAEGLRSTESGSGPGVESVACKYQLILAVLQCARSLLRADAVLYTRARSRARSHTRSGTPQRQEEEEEEEEEED